MKKFLIGTLITLLVIIVILAIAVVVVINLTPKQLGIADINIMDMTLSDLGLADTKFIDIIKSFKSIAKPNESAIVTNSYSDEEEQSKSNAITQGSTLDGKDNYASIITEQVKYDKKMLKGYDDTTLAYMLNNAIQNSTGADDNVKALKDANISIKEITINKDDNSIRVVGSVNLSSFTNELKDVLGAASKIIKIPEKVYLVSTLTIDGVDPTGKLQLSSKDICLNGNNDDPVSKAIMKLVLKKTGGSEDDSAALNNKLGGALADVIANLGQIGTATVDANGVVTGAETIGTNGIYNNKITVITYVKD